MIMFMMTFIKLYLFVLDLMILIDRDCVNKPIIKLFFPRGLPYFDIAWIEN